MSEQEAPRPVAARPFELDGQLTISVNVSNLEAAIAWYQRAFGFELIYKLDEYGWCELRTPLPGVSVGLGQADEPKITGGTSPTWGVADIDAARRHLESVGAAFDGETYEIEGMVRLATFHDPDGNPWMLAQALQEVPPAGGQTYTR